VQPVPELSELTQRCIFDGHHGDVDEPEKQTGGTLRRSGSRRFNRPTVSPIFYVLGHRGKEIALGPLCIGNWQYMYEMRVAYSAFVRLNGFLGLAGDLNA